MRASNIAVFRASIGVMVTDQVEGLPKHSAWVTFSNVLTDYCVQGMVINGSNTVSLSSGSFQSHEKSLYVEGAGGTIRVGVVPRLDEERDLGRLNGCVDQGDEWGD